jgi:prepilin-type N-terminal cleavage/methylation domain-containing protein
MVNTTPVFGFSSFLAGWAWLRSDRRSHGKSKGVSLRPERNRRKGAFSLVELLTVLAIMSLITAFAVPAFTGVKDADNVTNASYTVSSTLQRARTYAMAHNTYVWVGFYEEAADAPAPTNVFPYVGMGRLILGTVASTDGTQISTNPLAASRLVPIDKLTRVQNIHVTDLGAPTGGSSLIANRPNGAYNNNGTISPTELYGINSDSATERTPYTFTIGAYTFYKTICFSPSGEASIDGSTFLRRVGEIDVRPTHGDRLDLNAPNVAAIQFTGIGGGVQTYRN